MSSNQQTKNKPANTLFKQQRLASWQPIMSPPHVTACFIIVAAIFIPIGAAIFTANKAVVDIEVRYDNVRRCTNNDNEGIFTYNVNGTTTSMGCRILVPFNVTETMSPPVYMYYGMKNFYQNHRSYAKSRNEKQLAGSDITSDSELRPIRHPGENLLSAQLSSTQITVNGQTRPIGEMVYNPAGLVAWSKFNDTFRLYKINATTGRDDLVCDADAFYKSNSQPKPIPNPATLPATVGLYTGPNGNWNWATQGMPCHKQGIAWQSDREVKFKTPAFGNSIWTARRLYYLENDTMPTGATAEQNATYNPTSDNDYYLNGWYAGEAGHEIPVSTDEDLMVWMRTAALPNFRKLYRVIDVELPPGEYVMEVFEQYDVSSFNGEKYFAVATVSWVGGKNGFLGEAYIAVGVCAFVAGVIFFLVHKVLGDRTQKAVESLNELQ